MHIHTFFEFSMGVDRNDLHSLLSKAYENPEYLEENESENEVIDCRMDQRGIVVVFRERQYKSKVKLIVSSSAILKGTELNSDEFIRKLEKRVLKYFNYQYQLLDFHLSAMNLTVNIDVGSPEKVSAYIRTLQKIRKVKGFSPESYEGISEAHSFCLEGNSNFISFKIYDLQKFLSDSLKKTDFKMIQSASGMLQAEVRLMKPKAIRAYTDELTPSRQIVDLCNKRKKILFNTFTRIIPCGSYYKKDDADVIIQQKIKDLRLQKKMLHLTALIPEKKSLLSAQKALNYRQIDKVMKAFADIDLSPITISKRDTVKHLKSIYAYL